MFCFNMLRREQFQRLLEWSVMLYCVGTCTSSPQYYLKYDFRMIFLQLMENLQEIGKIR